MAVTLRPAVTDDCAALSALALRSKGHWGYDAAFLEACRDELTVEPGRLAVEEVTVAEDDGVLAGFASVDLERPDAELTMLFVAPEHIGTGTGRRLWDDAVAAARHAGARRLLVESDPHAEGFYAGRGARRIGVAPSMSIADRVLPLLALDLAAR